MSCPPMIPICPVSSPVDNSTLPYITSVTSTSGGAGSNYYDVTGTTSAGTTVNLGSDSIGDGTTSGASGLDSSGFINSLGTAISGALKNITGQNVQRLPNGQYLLPNGQVVGSSPIFSSGSGNILLIAGAGVLILMLFMAMSHR